MKRTERPEGFDKLPKRFKDYVASLESDVYALEKARPVSEQTRVRIVDRTARHDGREESYLPNGTEVAFRVRDNKDEGEWVTVKLVEFRPKDWLVELHAEWDGLAIYPSSSNVAFVGMVKR